MKLSNFKFEQLSVSRLKNVMGGNQSTHTQGLHTVSAARDGDASNSDYDNPFPTFGGVR
nr:hypothetical protein BACY1_00340 [Tenacibaculum mesophilum]